MSVMVEFVFVIVVFKMICKLRMSEIVFGLEVRLSSLLMLVVM